MNAEHGACNRFDAYIKKSIANCLKDYIRTTKNYHTHYISFSELSEYDLNSATLYRDTYPSEMFCENIKTRLFDATIHDELLYSALMQISQDIREILLLKFWGDLSDKEVGQAMCMSRQMVCYNKNKALKMLKKIIEELRKNE